MERRDRGGAGAGRSTEGRALSLEGKLERDYGDDVADEAGEDGLAGRERV